MRLLMQFFNRRPRSITIVSPVSFGYNDEVRTETASCAFEYARVSTTGVKSAAGERVRAKRIIATGAAPEDHSPESSAAPEAAMGDSAPCSRS